MPPKFNRQACTGCGMCVEICPGDVLRMADGKPELAYPEECWHCGACMLDCPSGAIDYHVSLPCTLPNYPNGVF
jgi:adenylylsulfate reductase subunit B